MHPIAYFPVYAGLGISMVLALACNAFLDIQYGSFGTEMIAWSIVATVSLALGWRYRQRPEPETRSWQMTIAGIGAFLFVVIFMPIWGLPRAGAYLLAFLQAAVHVSLTRRNFYFSALICLVLVLFAASHHRADWTLLFYLVPFVIALVFTVTAEQVSRRAAAVQAISLARGTTRGQWLAVGAAALLIFCAASAFYAITPQASPLRLFWEYGLPSNDVKVGKESGQAGSGPGSQGPGGGQGGGTGRSGAGDSNGTELGGMDWPSPAEMRRAAGRSGMPSWQAQSIRGLADLSEAFAKISQSLSQSWHNLMEGLRKTLESSRQDLLKLLLTLIVLALVLAYWFLGREVRPMLWLRTRIDYLHYAVLGRDKVDCETTRKVYAACTRLFSYHGHPRLLHCNTREYLAQLNANYPDLRRELEVLTNVFEAARYGLYEPGEAECRSAGRAYRAIFRRLAG